MPNTSVSIPIDSHRELKEFCEARGLKLSFAMVALITSFLDSGLELQEYLARVEACKDLERRPPIGPGHTLR